MFRLQSKINMGLSLVYFLCLIALIGCAPQSNHFGMVFASFNNAGADIYRMPNITQDKIEQLTFTPTVSEKVLLASKNGDKIIFGTGPALLPAQPADLAKEGLNQIFFLDSDSNKLVNITKVLTGYLLVPKDFGVDWSPDQKQLVVVTYQMANFKFESFLEFMDFEGKNKNDILIPTMGKIPSLTRSAKWSPDGRKFVLTSEAIGLDQQLQNPGDALLVFNLESGEIKQLADYVTNCFSAVWSPTSQQIAATCRSVLPNAQEVLTPLTVRIFNTDNPDRSYERSAFNPCHDPSWSPDGQRIAFICDKDKYRKGLFIVNSDGNIIHEVNLGNLGNPIVLENPTWSPDGTQIIYVTGTDTWHENIYSVTIDGSNNRALTTQSAYYQVVSVYPVP